MLEKEVRVFSVLHPDASMGCEDIKLVLEN
jgi:hypothetical protein